MIYFSGVTETLRFYILRAMTEQRPKQTQLGERDWIPLEEIPPGSIRAALTALNITPTRLCAMARVDRASAIYNFLRGSDLRLLLVAELVDHIPELTFVGIVAEARATSRAKLAALRREKIEEIVA